MSTGANVDRSIPLVAFAPLETPLGTARLYGTEGGLLFVALPGESRDLAERWLRRATSGCRFVEDAGMLREAAAQLREYFAGERRAFTLPLDWRGTPFQRAVWESVSAIPYGETRTYGELAASLGRPNAARAVGGANGANPLAPIVPCHRLVGLDGSLRGYGAGLATKRWLLDLERSGKWEVGSGKGLTRSDSPS